MESYNEKLRQEAALWGSVAIEDAQRVPPDWTVHRHLRHNAIMHTAHIDEMLSLVQPGMRTLELGCGSGWLTLAMAQRGAEATGLDISEQSVRIACDYYTATADHVSGTAAYAVADLNHLALAPNAYDMVVTRGTLHHLVGMRHVVEQVHRALRPTGLFWVSDQDGDEALSTALVAGALMFVLPTTVSYREKFAGLARFGLAAPSRIKASMEAEGLSPFEGAGRDHDWVKLISENFTIEHRIVKPAITGYITHQLDLPDGTALPLLRGLRRIDQTLVNAGVLHSTGVILYARK
jgi:2-polyprenyl-3-methyl-5-hydroxy-6-metoxy-1,4-benzoquinol methylase